jgi:hypothetical protein
MAICLQSYALISDPERDPFRGLTFSPSLPSRGDVQLRYKKALAQRVGSLRSAAPRRRGFRRQQRWQSPRCAAAATREGAGVRHGRHSAEIGLIAFAVGRGPGKA